MKRDGRRENGGQPASGEKRSSGDNPRYEVRRLIEEHEGRRVALALDRWTGRSVVLKSVDSTLGPREARCLLALPFGIAPRIADLAWRTSRGLIMVLERLPGKTLLEAARDTSPAEVPILARRISGLLAHLHRSGYVHSDVNPMNVILAGDLEPARARLLDLGFAIETMAGGDEEDVRGGMPPYIAPEVRRGWIVDGRADLFSLGVMLRTLFPALEEDPAWRRILEKLEQPIPAERYPHAVALRSELTRLFRLPPQEAEVPPFGAGPMRGRESSMRRLLDLAAASPGARILVQARPGTGLSRFLMEAVLAIARAGGPPAWIADLSEMGSGASLDRAIDSLDQAEADGEGIVLCGVGDPSPGLRWLGGRTGDRLRRLVGAPRWKRLVLPCIDFESFCEIVGASLGARSGPVEMLARALYERAEGNLKLSAEGFAHCVGRSGEEDGLSWRLDGERLERAIPRWRPSSVGPSLDLVSRDLVEPVRICAHAGRSFPADLIRRLLDRFACSAALPAILDHALLIEEEGGRLRFITRDLREAAASGDHAKSREIDRWLHANWEPDPGRVEEVLDLCAIAWRVGDEVKSRRWLSAALESADRQRRWPDLLTIVSRVADPGRDWTPDVTLESLAQLRARLSSDWSAERLFVTIALSLRSVAPGTSLLLLERAAAGQDPEAAGDALVYLADRVASQPSDGAFTGYMSTLRESEWARSEIRRAILDLLEAQHALGAGQTVEAKARADRAVQGLRGSGLHQEALSLLTLATALFPQDPGRAAGIMREALANASDPETAAQLRYNLTLLHTRLGEFESAAKCADEGIQEAGDRASLLRRTGLRIQRAWSWAYLDQIESAMEEARDLLSRSIVRQVPSRRVPVLLLVAYCHLHRGERNGALRESVRAIDEGQDGVPVVLQADVLRFLVDALLDIGDWDRVRERAQDLLLTLDGGSAAVRTATARARALLAQEKGSLNEAMDLLRREVEAGRRLDNKLAAARYLHHLGLLQLDRAGQLGDQAMAESAADLFAEELEILSKQGMGYHRGRALLALSRALIVMREKDEAEERLSQAICIARECRCRGLLAECLELRAREQMTETNS